MSKGAAQWRSNRKQLAKEVGLLREIDLITNQKDQLYKQLQETKRTLIETRARHSSDAAELRRPHSSFSNRMSEYERERLVEMLKSSAVERGQLEALVEFYKAKAGKLQVEVEFQKAKVCQLETKTELGGDMPLCKTEWRKTYLALARLLHPDKNNNAGGDESTTKAMQVANWLNDFYTENEMLFTS
jgi:hypothetical protein